MAESKKELWIALILWGFLGGVGAHHLYLNRTKQFTIFLTMQIVATILCFTIVGAIVGIPMLIGTSIWWFIDLFTMSKRVEDENRRLFGSVWDEGV